MTKSAKQDASNAAKAAGTVPGETESVATQPEAAPAPGETAESPADATAEADETEHATDLDETKRKFREALERKHQAHNEGQGKGGRDDGKIHGAHGPAASRRNFRRKSG